MRKPPKTKRNPAKKFRRFSLTTVIVAAAIVAIGAVAIGAVAIRSKSPEVNGASAPERSTPVENKAGKKFVTVKMAGQDVEVDGQTGQIKQLSPEEAQKLATGLKQLVNKSVADREVVRHEDGTELIDTRGRFQSVMVAKEDENGNLVQACVDSPQAAAQFFGLDPKLVENAPDDRTFSPQTSPRKTRN